MNRKELPKVENEVRTSIDTIFFDGIEFDCISHFYPEEVWFRVRDFWGREGWCIGYRDYVESNQKFVDRKTGKVKGGGGFGGEIYIKYDHDGSYGGLAPEMAERI